MAIQATTVWEFRTSGLQTNGGGYDASIAGAGTDYTQQDAAQLALSDLAMAQNSTTLTSATGGFTTAMIGNAIYIASGTNFIPGYYFITARASTNSVTVDRTAATAGIGASGVGKLGGGIGPDLPSGFSTSVVSGNVIWLKTGSYTFTQTFSFPAGGSSTVYPRARGYNVIRGDNPTGANRPSITTAQAIAFGDYGRIDDVIISTSNANGLYFNGAACKAVNCKVTNTNSGANYAIRAATAGQGIALGCELSSTGAASVGGYQLSAAVGCYYTGTGTGFHTCRLVQDCIIVGAGKGIDVPASGSVNNCTIYNCTTGCRLSGDSSLIANSIVSACGTVGISTGVGAHQCTSEYNYLYSNGANYSTVVQGLHDVINVNPLLNNPGGGDYTLQLNSPCLAAGVGPGLNTGLSSSYKINIGADQGDHVMSGATDFAHFG